MSIDPDKMKEKKFSVCEPNIGPREKELVDECFDTGWISSQGPFVKKFEKKFADFCQAKYGCSATNGTTALHLALATIGVEKGDEVIIPDFTMIASCNAVLYTGAKPVLVDAEKETWNMDLTQIEKKITDKTKAIMVMHTYGHPCDMQIVKEIADKHDLLVVEDAAEAHGAEYKGKRVGAIGDIGSFSFYANKILTTGEGGMVVTNNEEYNDKAHILMNHGFSKEKHFWHKVVGFNYRMTNMQAAIGMAQLERVDEFVEAKRRNSAAYTKILSQVPGITTPPEKEWAKNVFWMYGIMLEDEFGVKKDEARQALAEKGIETRSFFIPMHAQPAYLDKGLFAGEKYPIADEFCRKGFYLPSSTKLTQTDIEEIANTLGGLKK